ncbi:MAG: hypothetical protein U1E05_13565 [Patescibacteria group bacterium]|nr:hypothetical protein [Patescibacteria group bacterium]
MNTNESNKLEARLKSRLIREAAADRPEFSQQLHDRIVQSLREAPPRGASYPAQPRLRQFRWSKRAWLAGSAAAAVVIVLAAWLVRDAQRDTTAAGPAPPIASDGAPESGSSEADTTPLAVVAAPAADRFAAMVDATVAGSQWAYLDHDAQLATALVWNHIPFATSQTETQ